MTVHALILGRINAAASEWHECMCHAANGSRRKRTMLSRAADLEERLDRLWARRRAHLAKATRDRFKDAPPRITWCP